MSDDREDLFGKLLQSLSTDGFEDPARFGRREHVRAGAVIVREGDVIEHVHVIEAGQAEVVLRDPKGRAQVLAVLGPGDSIGEMGFLTGGRASSTVMAVTELDLVSFTHQDMNNLVRSHPELERALGRVVALRLARQQRRIAGHETRVVHVVASPTADRHVGALAASAAWHCRRPVVAIRPGGTLTHDVLAQTWGRRERDVRGEVIDVDSTVLRALPQLAASLAGRVGALLVITPRDAAPDSAATTIDAWPASEPSTADLADIERGLLPPTSPYGEEIARRARAAIGRRVGVAFGAGSARGFAHAGVIDVFRTAGVPIDAVAGTSIGGAVAALVALGRDGDAIQQMLERAGRLVVRPRIGKSSLFSIRHLARYFQDLVGDTRIEDLPIPAAIVAADLDTGEEVVFRDGLLRAAVLASIAIPGVYPPQHLAGRRLIDGAALNPVPADVVAALDADVVVAVKLATRSRARVEASATPGGGSLPWAPQVILRSVDIMSNALARALPFQASVVVEPSFAGAGGSLGDFKRGGAQFRAEGKRAAESCIADVVAQLPWLA